MSFGDRKNKRVVWISLCCDQKFVARTALYSSVFCIQFVSFLPLFHFHIMSPVIGSTKDSGTARILGSGTSGTTTI